MNGLVRWLAGLALIIPAIGALQGCKSEDKICMAGEVVVEKAGGGRHCEQPAPGDPACPRGEVLLKAPDVGRVGCIPDVWTPDPLVDKLPPTTTK